MPERYENLSPNGHLALAEEIFRKFKIHLDTKGDTKVTQTGSISTNADYEILLSKSANDTTETDTVNKASGLTYNPSTNQLNIVGDLKWEPLAGGEHGIYWKEQGFGDKFKIYPHFSGSGDQNYLTIATATGDADTDPNLAERFKFLPSGAFYTIYGSLHNQIPSVTVDTSSNNHVSANVSTGMYIDDSNNFPYSRFRGQAYTNGTVYSDICAINKKTDGTEVENHLGVYVAKDGTKTYNISDAANFRTALGLGSMATASTTSYVAKSGDTMTGSLTVNGTLQANNYNLWAVQSDSATEVQAGVKNTGTNGSNLYLFSRANRAGIYSTYGATIIGIDNNKKVDINGVTYAIANPGEFRTALGLGAAATRGVYDRSTTGHLDWDTYKTSLVTNATLAYWNGRYNGGSSNLQYCDRGRFGTIVTREASSFVKIHTTGWGTVLSFKQENSWSNPFLLLIGPSAFVVAASGTLSGTHALSAANLRTNTYKTASGTSGVSISFTAAENALSVRATITFQTDGTFSIVTDSNAQLVAFHS